MKNRIKRLNFILALLLVLMLGAGCGRQKVVELPTGDESSYKEDINVSDESSYKEEISAGEESSSGEETYSENGSTGGLYAEDEIHYVLYEDGAYTSKDDVARYLNEFGRLPSNFITKKEAKALGWPGGSLEEYAPGKCIGGDRFGNYEGLLPEEKGRKYFECDIGTLGKKSRGDKRIVYSNDGLIFYTDDHYKSFTQLY